MLDADTKAKEVYRQLVRRYIEKYKTAVNEYEMHRAAHYTEMIYGYLALFEGDDRQQLLQEFHNADPDTD